MEVPSEQPPLVTVERQLARLRFDLHDGPQQDVHLLADELRLFREQLAANISGHPNEERLLGRLDDIAARLESLDEDIRRLAATLSSPFQGARPLRDELAELVEEFTGSTDTRPRIRLKEDSSRLTDSQQIAVLSLIREALSNVRKHSDASHVEVEVTVSDRTVQARVVDDGTGFDPQSAIERARRSNHLGLIGMRERATMLGGHTEIDSRPGGPTVVAISLPAWHEASEDSRRPAPGP